MAKKLFECMLRWVFQSKFSNYQDLIEAGNQVRAKWNEDPIKVEQVSSFE